MGHGIAPNRKYLHIITTTQRLTHRILGIAEQARTHVAIGRQAQTVAIRTKMVGHGANKANRSRRARKAPIARRTRAGRSVVDVERLELAQSRRSGPGIDARPQLVARHGVTRIPQRRIERGRMRVYGTMRTRALVADGHVFDKAQVDGAVDGQPRKGRHILVEPAHHNAVDLNGLKAPSQRRVDAGHGLFEST